MKTLKSRIYYLDFTRVTAVLLVILFHYLSELESFGLLKDPNAFKVGGISLLNLGGVNLTLGNYAFSVFFILAGVVLMHLYQESFDIKEFYKKCMVQILPVYYLAFTIAFLIRAVAEQRVNHGAPLWTLLLTVFGIDGWLGDVIPNYGLVGDWFVGCILGIYLLFPLLRKCVNKNPYITLIAYGMVFLLWEYFYPISFSKRYDLFLRTFEVLMGMYFVKINKKVTWRGFGISILLLGLIFAVRIPYISVYVLMPVAGGSLFLVLNYISKWFEGEKIKKAVAFLCQYSFPVFLVHHFLINTIMSKIPQGSIDIVGMILLFINCMIITWAIGIGIKQLKLWIERATGYEAFYFRYISKAVLIIAFAMYISHFIVNAFIQVPSFDGSMNLQVPVTLLRSGLYATSYDGISLFASRIQTGAPVLLPIAAVFKIFGIGSAQALMVNVFYIALLLFFVYKISAELKADRITVLFVMGITAVLSGFMGLSMGIYGEIPALALFLGTVYFLLFAERKSKGKIFFVSGMFFGLSYLTKTVILIAVPALILVFASKLLLEKRLKIKDICLWIMGAVLPVIVFEIYKIVQLGMNKYIAFWQNQSDNILKQAGVKEGYEDTAGLIQKLGLHLKIYSETFNIQIAALIVILALNFIWFACRVFKRKKLDYIDIVELVMYSYFGWWLLITPTEKAWGRRILIGVVLFGWITSMKLPQIFEWVISKEKPAEYNKIKAIAGTIISIFVLLFIGLGAEKYSEDQKKGDVELAEVVKQKTEEEKAIFCGYGWWQAPVISFYSGVDFKDLRHLEVGMVDAPVYFVADAAWLTESGLTEEDLPYSVNLVYTESYTGQKLYEIHW